MSTRMKKYMEEEEEKEMKWIQEKVKGEEEKEGEKKNEQNSRMKRNRS